MLNGPQITALADELHVEALRRVQKAGGASAEMISLHTNTLAQSLADFCAENPKAGDAVVRMTMRTLGMNTSLRLNIMVERARTSTDRASA